MTTKLAIAIDLDELRRLMREYVDSIGNTDDDIMTALHMNRFLLRLQRRQRQEQPSEQA